MGVFSASVSESFGYGNIPELEINDYNAGALTSDNFAEMAILGSVDVTAIHKSLVESLAAQEIAAVEEGYEVVYEASSFSSVVEKVKNLIKKAIEKIKSLFEKAIAVFRSWTSSDKDFIKKYQTTFTKNWVKLKKLDMKIFKYHDDIKKMFTGQVSDATGEMERFIDAFEQQDRYVVFTDGSRDYTVNEVLAMTSSNIATLEKIKEATEKIDSTDDAEKLRGMYYALGKNVSNSSMTAKEYSDSLYEYYRCGEDSKDTMDKSELEKNGYSSTDIISRLSNGEKSTSNFDKAYKRATKVLNKKIETLNKKVSKAKYNDDKDIENKFTTLNTWAVVRYSSALSTLLECYQTEHGQFIQACKEYSRTCKSIATKVVAMGEKRLAQEESWDYEYDNDYSNGFMNSVIIK